MLQWLATKSPKKEDPETPQKAESDVPQVSRQFLQKSLFPSKGGSWSDGRSGRRRSLLASSLRPASTALPATKAKACSADHRGDGGLQPCA